MKKAIFKLSLLAISVLTLASCSEKTVVSPAVDTELLIPLSAMNENPAPAGRMDNGEIRLKLYADNRLDYSMISLNMRAGDRIQAAHIHTGDAGSNGPVVIDLMPDPNAVQNFGGILQLTADQAAIIRNKQAAYVNVHSVENPNGLMRGQLETTVVRAWDVALSGRNEVPANSTGTTGTARFRLTADNNLYSTVNVMGLATADAITMAHIHTGAAGTNGPVSINLFPGGATDLGKTIKSALNATQVGVLTGSGPIYANVHSTLFPGGIVRGQIR